MNINGIPPGNSRIGNVEGKPKTDPAGSGRNSEPVNGTQSAPVKDRLEDITLVVDTEFEPRPDLIDTVTRRVSGEESDSRAETGSATDTERAGETDRNVSSGYYDSEEVVRLIAENILPIIDISGMFGNDAS